MTTARNEYPRPQMVRENWLNLNGEWEFEFDFSKSGLERNLVQKDKFEKVINVPFCPESELSGINFKDFMNAVWYKKQFTLPETWTNGRVLLNFEAVDYYCEIYVNGEKCTAHKGGYTPFTVDITTHLNGECNTVVVYAEDDNRTDLQPCGKQSKKHGSWGTKYTRVTGIWQTVWLEFVPDTYISDFQIIPDIYNNCAHITVNFSGTSAPKTVVANAYFEGKLMGSAEAKTTQTYVQFSIPLAELHLWQPLDGKLYDITFEMTANTAVDTVNGYFGMRSIRYDGKCFQINDKPIFMRLVLDQGYYPDGIYTAPSDDALAADIEMSIKLGFNGARLHQKVFERRFLYHADKMGYMIWGEYGNWGLNHTIAQALEIFMPEWLESVKRDFNSPALIGWCPFNETWDLGGHQQDDEVLRCTYLATKAADNTRPVIDTSGNYHVVTDIYDVHAYQQDIEKFREYFAPMKDGGEVFDNYEKRQKYGGQPYFISEYGGIWWCPSGEGWGYGSRPNSPEEFADRYTALAEILLTNPKICGLCYTQLYDVEQEVNGLYDYYRKEKFTPEITKRLTDAMTQPAAIETCEK